MLLILEATVIFMWAKNYIFVSNKWMKYTEEWGGRGMWNASERGETFTGKAQRKKTTWKTKA
jgi:hypothetical protein